VWLMSARAGSGAVALFSSVFLCVKGSSGNVQDNTGLSHAEPASAPAPPLTVNGEHVFLFFSSVT